MADKLPLGPSAPARQKRDRDIWSQLTPLVQQPTEDGPAATVDAPAQEPDVSSPPTIQEAPRKPAKKPAQKPSKKSAGSNKAKRWDRTGQIAVVLGGERHTRLKDVWQRNAGKYDAIADLVREAIDEKLDQLD